MNEQKQQKRIFQGVVTSNKMQKTLVVRIDRMKLNPKYGKQYQQSRKFHVHNENGKYNIGDVVRFVETRPLSKLKRWRVLDKVTAV